MAALRIMIIALLLLQISFVVLGCDCNTLCETDNPTQAGCGKIKLKACSK